MENETSVREQDTEEQRVARGMLGRWAQAFNAGDWERLVALYSADAQHIGGKPEVFIGPHVLDYFSVLRPGASVAFDEPQVACPIPNVILIATVARFTRDGVTRPHRLSHTLVFQQERWQLASHHASPVPTPVPAN